VDERWNCSQKQILSVQLLRAAAAILVLFAHLNSEMAGRLGYEQFDYLGTGQVGVDLFFVTSGFVIVLASERLFGTRYAPIVFFVRRAIRVVPLYWLSTMVVLVHVLRNYDSLASAVMSWPLVAASFFFIPYPNLLGAATPVHGVGWSLNYEMLFYVIFAFSIPLQRNLAVGVCSCLLVTGVVAGRIFDLPMPLKYWFDPIVLEFVFGMWIGVLYRSSFTLSKAARIALIVLSVIALAITTQVSYAHRIIEWGLPCAFLVASAVLGPDVSGNSTLCKVGVLLGNSSYSIYLMHPFAFAVPRLLFGDSLADALPWTLYASILLLFSFLFSIITYLLVERRMTDILKAILFRHPAKVPAS
jgi:exopolysaccharide production protein ExoZ